MDGWVKIHRKIIEWEWYQDSQMVHLFIHLLLSANHEDKKWRGHTVKRGQLITGLHKLSENTGISIQSLRTRLEKLSITREIVIKSTNKFSIITILNYEDYQIIESTPNKQLTNNQQTTNNKQELKNVKNKSKREYTRWQDLNDYAKEKYGIELNKERWRFEYPPYPTRTEDRIKHQKKWKPIIDELNNKLLALNQSN